MSENKLRPSHHPRHSLFSYNSMPQALLFTQPTYPASLRCLWLVLAFFISFIFVNTEITLGGMKRTLQIITVKFFVFFFFFF